MKMKQMKTFMQLLKYSNVDLTKHFPVFSVIVAGEIPPQMLQTTPDARL